MVKYLGNIDHPMALALLDTQTKVRLKYLWNFDR
jgi:hypothetical protein